MHQAGLKRDKQGQEGKRWGNHRQGGGKQGQGREGQAGKRWRQVGKILIGYLKLLFMHRKKINSNLVIYVCLIEGELFHLYIYCFYNDSMFFLLLLNLVSFAKQKENCVVLLHSEIYYKQVKDLDILFQQHKF